MKIMASKFRNIHQGFTLVELVIVIMLLGIVSVGAGGIIKLASQVFVDVTNRDELIASVRFSVERLNRELREALPNSVQVFTNANGNECLEYMPIATSAVYLDIPVRPESPTNELSVIRFDDSLYSTTNHIVVYPLSPEEVYGASSKRYAVDESYALNTSGNEWVLKLATSEVFEQDSPTNRLFMVEQPVSYCAEQGALMRYSNYGYNSDVLNGDAVLMAQNLVTSGTVFQVDAADLYRNSLVHLNLQFAKNNEVVNFYNEVQVKNVP